jgi:polyisoprenyl-phosphate glycosyltransferase
MTTVVIPACDEAASIGDVVAACVGAVGVGAVIVVVNGTDNGTATAATNAGAGLVLWQPAADKGAAMAAGLAEVHTERVLFCDADLIGLTPEHVEAMVTVPPFGGQLCGLTDTVAAGLTKYLPPITGQRRLPTAVARRIPLGGSGYRAELHIDAAIGRLGLPHRTVILRGVTNPTNAATSPARFAKMAASVLAASVYLAPELLAYEVRG